MNEIEKSIYKKIIEREKIRENLENIKNKRIVFTNGCFDILHKGHLLYLIEAKKEGDFLIVALNSDSSIKRLKGDIRPINKLEDRLFNLACISFVDFVTWFDEDDPIETLKIIRPDLHVKGGDYKEEDLKEYNILKELNIKLKIIPYIDGYSTTSIINKLKYKD